MATKLDSLDYKILKNLFISQLFILWVMRFNLPVVFFPCGYGVIEGVFVILPHHDT